jgi:hypothetical protein
MSETLTHLNGILVLLLTLVLGFVFSIAINPGNGPLLQFALGGALVPDSTPSDWISESQIRVYEDRFVVDIEDPLWVAFTPTNSMTPLLNHESHGIEIMPNSEDDLKLGDVVAYENPRGEVILHRLVEINQDEKGKYFIFQGDNVPQKDPYKVRFNQIRGVLVAVIY